MTNVVADWVIENPAISYSNSEIQLHSYNIFDVIWKILDSDSCYGYLIKQSFSVRFYSNCFLSCIFFQSIYVDRQF